MFIVVYGFIMQCESLAPQFLAPPLLIIDIHVITQCETTPRFVTVTDTSVTRHQLWLRKHVWNTVVGGMNMNKVDYLLIILFHQKCHRRTDYPLRFHSPNRLWSNCVLGILVTNFACNVFGLMRKHSMKPHTTKKYSIKSTSVPYIIIISLVTPCNIFHCSTPIVSLSSYWAFSPPI